MKIAVVGAGIIGITTAYELTMDGHDVTVYEKNASVAELASFATGGSLAPSLSQPFSHTAWPKSGNLARFITSAAMLPPKAFFSFSAFRWTFAWSKARPAEQFHKEFSANVNLLHQSIARLGAICQSEKIEFEQSPGQVILVRSEAASKLCGAKFAALKELGIAHKTLDAAELSKTEPSLNPPDDVRSAVYFPGDLVGNCRQFAQLLKDRAVAAGAKFVFSTAVKGIKCDPRVELSLTGTSEKVLSEKVLFDSVVLCTGAAMTELLEPLKIKIPLMAAHAYSLSAQMREPLNGPRSAVFDSKSDIGIARIGNRIRATGSAQLGLSTASGGGRAQEKLYRAIQRFFPGAATLSNSTQFWHASTLISPDSMPAIGATGVQGVYANLGHGFNGWGMACGSARLLADEFATSGNKEPIATFSPTRFKR
jgi:D-amino-acid dehydrogenase